MRNILLAAGLVGLFCSVQACGGDDRAPAFTEAGTGATGSGGKDSGGSGGKGSGGKGSGGSAGKSSAGSTSTDAGAGGEPEPASNGPVVKITSPSEALTPDDGVLVEQSVKVLCTVTPSSAAGASDVDLMTIKLSIADADGKELETKNAAATNADNEFTADFVLATVPTGAVSFTCSAKDKNNLLGENTISAFVDHGPTIIVTSPEPKAAFAVKGGLNIDFEAQPNPLVKGDAGAEVDKVVFTLDGKEFAVEEKTPGRFQASLQLDDPDDFPITPTGAISISATNSRAPTPVTATKSYSITIDGDGPVITILSPSDKAVLGGPRTLEFTVDDASSGVDPNSVNVALWADQEPVYFDPNNGWTRVGNKYTYAFDTKAIEPHAKVQTLINVLASDAVGNATPIGQSITIYLDNVPPKIDLDPMNVRTINGSVCSNSFDPVGPQALNDLQGVMGDDLLNPIGFFRAFVREQTNSQPGQKIFYHSLTDQSQVRLYVQAQPEQAATKLLVNKNPLEDDTCDDIGGVDDLNNAPPFSALHAIKTNASDGTEWYQNDPGLEPSVTNKCTLEDKPEPQHLCPTHSSDMWYAAFNPELNEPNVYVVGTPSSDVSCAGIDLAFLTNDQMDGWVCAAARVVDKAGNVGISPPLRLCAVSDPKNPPACRISSTVPPTCTDGCTPPSRGGNIIIKH